MTDPTPQTTPTRDEAVPAGWKLVPIEPLPEMLGAFWRVKNGHHYADEPEPTDRSDYAAYAAMLASAPAVDAVAFHEAYELIFEAYSGPADVHATDTAWAMAMSRKINKAFPLLQKVRASLSPAPTSGSEAGGEP